jgi:hypothetical protein
MSDDELHPYTSEERQALKKMLRDPSTVKDLFNQQRMTFSKTMEQIKALKALSPVPANLENLELDLKARVDLNDTIEAMILNQIQHREEIKEIIDAVLTNDHERLKRLRQKADF